MKSETRIRALLHFGGVLNTYLVIDNLVHGGAYLILAVGHTVAVAIIARSLDRLDRATEGD